MATSDGPLSREHARLVRTAMKRGADVPEDHFPGALVGEYPEPILEQALANWRARMVHEHRSAAVFSGLLPQLMAAGAPLEFKTTVLRASMDEIRHASLCGHVIELLGGEAVAEAELQPRPLPQHAGCTPREVALRNMMFAGCLSETVSVSLLSEERDATTEPVIRRVVEQLAADEVLHARLGWAYLAQTLPELSDEERGRVPKFLRAAFAQIERDMLGAMPLGADASEADEELLHALGVSLSVDGREIFAATMHEVVIPRLEDHGVPAARAWRERGA